MKTKIISLLLAGVALLAGCVSSSEQLNSIHIGMSRAEVITQLGQPDSTSAQGNIEYLTYYLANDSSLRNQPYSVRLVDQKVESFGRFTQLADIYNRPVNGSAPMNGGWVTGTTVMSPPMAATAAAPSLVNELVELKKLHDDKVLSDDEFLKAKQKLLGN